MAKKKKIIVLSCMVALLAVTAVFNYVFTTGTKQTATTQTVASSSANYFAQYRSERLASRNEELLQLDAVIAAAESDSAEKSAALTMKTNIAAKTEKEMLLESLIKAYGFEDAVVVIGLDSEDAIAIYTIVSEEASVSPENVKIIPIS